MYCFYETQIYTVLLQKKQQNTLLIRKHVPQYNPVTVSLLYTLCGPGKNA